MILYGTIPYNIVQYGTGVRTSGASINTPYEKEISHEIPTFGQLRTPGFGGGARHNDLRRRMGLGFSQGRSTQGVRRLSRGRGQFHRRRQLLYKRDERIVSRRVYQGRSPERGAGHEILECRSGHRSERGRQSTQEYDA